jgi:hypothetical protein
MRRNAPNPSLGDRLRSLFARSERSKAPVLGRRLRLEPLEERQLLATFGVGVLDPLADETTRDPGVFSLGVTGRAPDASYDATFTLASSVDADHNGVFDYDDIYLEVEIFISVAGADYEPYAAAASYTIGFDPELPATALVKVVPRNDALAEGSHTVRLTAILLEGGCEGESLGVSNPSPLAAVTIADDDEWIVSVSNDLLGDQTVERCEGAVNFLVTRSGASDTHYPIVANTSLGGDADWGDDYSVWVDDAELGVQVLVPPSAESSDLSVTIAIGATTTTVTIVPNNDAVKEPDESVTLTITSAVTGGLDSGCCSDWGSGGPYDIDEFADTASVTIQDDDGWDIKVERTSAATIVERGPATTDFTLTRVDDGDGRSGDQSYGIDVDFTMSGLADFGVDYGLYDDQNIYISYFDATIPAEDIDTDVQLVTNNDHLWEPDEDAVFTVTGGTSVGLDGGVYGVDPFHGDDLVYILDDDHWIVSLEEDGTPGTPRTAIEEEGPTSAHLVLKRTHEVMTPTRSGDTTYPIDVILAYSGQASPNDYTVIGGVVLPDGTTSTTNFQIQEGQTQKAIEVKAVDDAYVEPLRERLDVTITGATYSGQAYTIGTDAEVELDIKDNDKLKLEWSEFQGHLNMIPDPGINLVYPANDVDPNDPNYQEPAAAVGVHHWEDRDGDGTVEDSEIFPVAYRSGKDVFITLQFEGEFEPEYVGETMKIQGVDSNGNASLIMDGTIYADRVLVSAEKLMSLPADMTIFLEDETLNWKSAFPEDVDANNDLIWRDAGTQTLTLYGTYKGELTGQYHTVIHLGSKNHGKTNDADVIDAIWGEFSDRQVKTVAVTDANEQPAGDMALWYYKTYGTTRDTTPLLLAPQVADGVSFGEGMCNAWVDLMLDVLAAQGIDQENDIVILKRNVSGGFLVNNWQFDGSGGHSEEAIVSVAGGHDRNALVTEYPYLNVVPANGVVFEATGSEYLWVYADVDAITGIDGQGPNSNPASLFNQHVVVELTVGGTTAWYDPSYGKKYTGGTKEARELDFEDTAVAGYFVGVGASVREAAIQTDLDGYPDTDTIVPSQKVYLIKDNPTSTKEITSGYAQ